MGAENWFVDVSLLTKRTRLPPHFSKNMVDVFLDLGTATGLLTMAWVFLLVKVDS